MRLAKKLDPDGIRQPTREEIGHMAFDLSREDYELDAAMEELFFWPDGADPCRDCRCLFLPILEGYWKRAEQSLRRHYAYYHALDCLRKRWLRDHPVPRGWAWSRQSLKNAIPPPRRRNYVYRPPELSAPSGLSPPERPPPDIPSKRPGRREKEILLCFSWLSDNRIAV